MPAIGRFVSRVDLVLKDQASDNYGLQRLEKEEGT